MIFIYVIRQWNAISYKENKENAENIEREEHFILDCTNKITSQMKKYNPLYDNCCSTFFGSIVFRTHLHKMGFINKKGYILGDPGKKICGRELNPNSLKRYEMYRKNLMRSKEDTEMIEDMIVIAMNDAVAKVDQSKKDSLGPMASMLGI